MAELLNPDTATIGEIEEYLKSLGGRWAEVPESLRRSIIDNGREADERLGKGEDGKLQWFIAEARKKSYDVALRGFAKAKQKSG